MCEEVDTVQCTAVDNATEWGICVPINGEPKERSNFVLLINPINVSTKVVLPLRKM